jgi:hypothetical protein
MVDGFTDRWRAPHRWHYGLGPDVERSWGVKRLGPSPRSIFCPPLFRSLGLNISVTPMPIIPCSYFLGCLPVFVEASLLIIQPCYVRSGRKSQRQGKLRSRIGQANQVTRSLRGFRDELVFGFPPRISIASSPSCWAPIPPSCHWRRSRMLEGECSEARMTAAARVLNRYSGFCSGGGRGQDHAATDPTFMPPSSCTSKPFATDANCALPSDPRFWTKMSSIEWEWLSSQ